MAKTEKMPASSTGDNNREVLLRELQKSIHFVKTLTPSHVPTFSGHCMMALPVWFILKHGDRFQQTAFLRSRSSTESWRVQLNIYNKPPKSPEIKFAKGWREFPAFNGFIEGDELLFSLRSLSVFDVYVIRGTPNPRQPSSLQAPRQRSHDFEFSPQKVNESGGRRDRHFNVEGSEGSVDNLSEAFAKNKTFEEEGAALALHGTATRNSSDFNLHFLQLRNSQDSSSSRIKSHANEYKDMAFEEMRNSPPSFLKRLKASNFHSIKWPARLEIPKAFVRTYNGSGLHPPIVKLQGIHERCSERIVICAWKSAGARASSLYLTDGWREFGDENGLEVRQELSFTLSADSFFVVRVNS